uniref:Reverse transcriptase domain-containing protein n=1 Tax=Tetraodon nigroviridis TaxID=99883 RepID=H3C6P6_TETNG
MRKNQAQSISSVEPVTVLEGLLKRVTISGVPPFIPNEALENGLRMFGMFASGFKTISLGCKDPKLRHVQSLRRQVFMFLDSPSQTLEVSFRALDRELTLEELMAAVNQLALGRAPGIDGLSTDFFRCFWSILGQDLHSVLLECLRTGSLPVSCRRAVLSLLPKKGDLALLKNWRPVALLCTDYKVLSRALSNRLKESLSFIIHSDQTYCIPDRSIMDNIFLIRDLIDVCRADMDYHFGIVCLDQEKAFDRVDHSYLFSTLRAFGFGDGFIAWVSLLHRGSQCLLKTGAGLSWPISVEEPAQ